MYARIARFEGLDTSRIDEQVAEISARSMRDERRAIFQPAHPNRCGRSWRR